VCRTIPDYFTPDFANMVEIWVNVKRWGMPFEGGWADQPAILMDVINLFEQAYNEYEEERLEKARH